MLRTLTPCSGRGGVGKTVLATTLARIIQKETNGTVLLVDLDVTVQGLTLLVFQKGTSWRNTARFGEPGNRVNAAPVQR
jgi:MinD-like ATPase involved in chromosome partitioning or flagellar assembly